MQIIKIHRHADSRIGDPLSSEGEFESLVTLLWELGTLGVLEEEGSVKAYFADTADLSSLLLQLGDTASRIREESLGSQTSGGTEEVEPILAGERFVIVSGPSKAAAVPGRIGLAIDAGGAFGSGRHESTQLTIQALEEYVRPGDTVVDAGCGSGILSAVAVHLRASLVVACDTQREALTLTRQHAPAAHVFGGSVDSIRSESMDVVVVNISARVIDELAQELHRITKAEGRLLLSGFLSDRVPQSFSPIAELKMNEWRCWICKRQSYVSPTREDIGNSLQPFATEWW